MTIWAAKSNFEETEKGSLEKGKFADFMILDKDMMKVEAKDILSTSVLATYLNGEKVYAKKLNQMKKILFFRLYLLYYLLFPETGKKENYIFWRFDH